MCYILNSGAETNVKKEEFLVPTLEGFEERTLKDKNNSPYNPMSAAREG